MYQRKLGSAAEEARKRSRGSRRRSEAEEAADGAQQRRLDGAATEEEDNSKDIRMADGGQEEEQRARKIRGPTTLKFLDTLLPGQRFRVESWLNSPVGPNSTYMATYISHLAKDGNKLPLTISHWTQMPAVFVLDSMSEVKKVFDYPDDLNDWIRAKLNDRWRYHKHCVKKEGFYKYKTQEERLAHRPKDVVESQWGPLIEYWQNPHQDAKCAKSRASKSKHTVQQSSGCKPHVKFAAELEAKLKRPPTVQEIYDATHVKRKKQIEGLENKPSEHSSESSSTRQNDGILQLMGRDYMSLVSSSKRMKMSAEASGSRGINAVPTSPVPLIQECVTEDNEDNMQAESDESLEGFGSFGEPEDNDDNVQAEPDDSLEGFGCVGEPAEPAEPARTTSSAEHVEAAKKTSSANSPTVDSRLVSISSSKDVSAPFIESANVFVRGSEEEFEFVDDFKIPKEYAVLYKKIFAKYGHMATRKVIKSNDAILVAFVTSLLQIISTMETVHGVDLSEPLLKRWDGAIEDVENLGFNIAWLREKLNEVKNNWNSSSGIRKEVEIHKEELDATQVKYASLLTRKEELQRETSEVIIQIRKAEAKISLEKKAIQQKLATKKNFLCEPVLGKVLS